MSRGRSRHWRRVGTLALSLAIASRAASAQSSAECIAAFDKGQELHAALKLHDARERLLACARDACPAEIREDCAKALEMVERDQPTLAFSVNGPAGRELTGARIFLDDLPVLADLSGRGLPVDPGPHRIRVEQDGYVPDTREIFLRAGERNRIVDVELQLAPTHAEPVPATPGVSPFVYVLYGTSALALGGFLFFGISGNTIKGDLRCAPRCSDDDTARVRTRFITADISLAVSIVAAGIATVALLSHPRAPHPAQARRAE